MGGDLVMQRFLCPAEAARVLGVSVEAVRKWIRTGRAKAERDARGWAFLSIEEVGRMQRELVFKPRLQRQTRFAEASRNGPLAEAGGDSR